jgi:predicted HicB family RNase H-like nuclease
MKKKQAPPYSLRLDPELRERVEVAAKADKRTLASYIIKTLDLHTPPLKSKGHLKR